VVNPESLNLTGDAAADELLANNPLALLVGMLLDQQVPMEWAFSAPATLAERLDGPLDARTVAATDPEALEALFRRKPALHRYPGAMAKRVHALCEHLVEQVDGDTARLWTEAPDGAELFRRLTALPGFGRQKAQIFTALLAKRCGVAPPGWEGVAGEYAAPGHRSIADVTGPDALARVREFKRARKAAAKGDA
jgi:uncharacterized HhH-GPD family protein